MKQGFSLVELSIVLVILGLLVGGILAGQSLIHASELRAVTSEYQRYATAVSAFRDKYFAVPGDMTNATGFWGSLGGTGSDTVCQAIDATGTATCNGDGDGSLLWGGSAAAANRYEWYRFWQHLANAGLIEGSYTGTAGSGYVPGTNLPLSKIANVAFLARNGLGNTAGTSTYYSGSVTAFAGDYGKSVFLYQGITPSSAVSGSIGLIPEDAWNIDSKVDDGVPGLGRVISNKGNNTNTICTTTAGGAPASDAGATYRLDHRVKDCMLYFLGALP